MPSSPVIAAALAPLVLWRVYSRIRRLTTRQRSHTWRHRTTLVFFPLLLVLVGLGALHTPVAFAALGAGLAAGIGLGTVALSKSVFEQVGDEFYFTPHAHIGVLVAMLFIGRMGYRAYEMYVHASVAQMDFVRSPLTLLTFGILAGYYMTYAVGLLRWRARTAIN